MCLKHHQNDWCHTWACTIFQQRLTKIVFWGWSITKWSNLVQNRLGSVRNFACPRMIGVHKYNDRECESITLAPSTPIECNRQLHHDWSFDIAINILLIFSIEMQQCQATSHESRLKITSEIVFLGSPFFVSYVEIERRKKTKYVSHIFLIWLSILLFLCFFARFCAITNCIEKTEKGKRNFFCFYIYVCNAFWVFVSFDFFFQYFVVILSFLLSSCSIRFLVLLSNLSYVLRARVFFPSI